MNPQENNPELWQNQLPRPKGDGHKYDRGHAVIFAAPELTGATRLAAEACSRIGAGLVTVLAAENADVFRYSLPADIMVMSAPLSSLRGVTAILGGPGGITAENLDAIAAQKDDPICVLDADALQEPSKLTTIGQNLVLTPHDGEFTRVFGAAGPDRILDTQTASADLDAIIVRKGAETIIAHPDGRTVLNRHADPYLAKAGTGDVLAGMITGLAAQNMPLFEACCAAVWMHGEAGIRIGPGLVASDIPGEIPAILKQLLE